MTVMSLHLKLCLCLVVILYGLHDQKMFFHKYAVHFHGRRGDVAEAVEWIHGGADDVGQPGIAAVIRIVLMEIDIIPVFSMRTASRMLSAKVRSMAI